MLYTDFVRGSGTDAVNALMQIACRYNNNKDSERDHRNFDAKANIHLGRVGRTRLGYNHQAASGLPLTGLFREMEFLNQMPLGAFFLFTCVFVLAAIEAGFRFGVFVSARNKPQRDVAGAKPPIESIVQSTLALLAFVLAFTFGATADRFSERRVLLSEEATAIYTAFLRADFLPPENQQVIQNLLRRYVQIRMRNYENDQQVIKAIAESGQLQVDLWKQTVAIGKANLDSDVTSLFVDSMNEVINLQERRVEAFRARIPESIWNCLYAMIFVSMFATGYQCGRAGARSWTSIITLVTAFAIILFIIADLDRPTEGPLKTSKRPLIDLSEKIGLPVENGNSPK